MPPIIRLEKVSYSYESEGLPSVRALDGVSLAIEQGEYVVILGHNGSGKSTLAKHLNALLLPSGGDVWVRDWNTRDLRHTLDIRRTVGMVFQQPDNQIVATIVEEDVAFGPENLRLSMEEIDKRVKESLANVGLTNLENQHPYELSGGQQRRLAIAGVLAMKPQMIIFDEPFNGLDYEGVVQTLQQIVQLHQNGHTILVITHDLEKVLAHATRLCIMQQGDIRLDGLPEEVLSHVEKYSVKRPSPSQRLIETMTWLR